MSELAYNLQGDRFEPPDEAAAWRVRRLKPGGRGTPDVVFSSDGAPLMLPLDTELAEFRNAVSHEPGRYRLDPVTEDHRPCDGGPPAYLQLAERDEASDLVHTSHTSGATEDLLRELVQANTEMVRNIADKFAGVMDSAATLIRAADGAGIPARQPVVAELPGVELEDDEDDDPRNAPGSELTSLLSQLMPLVQMTLAQKFGKESDGPRNAASEPDDDQAEEAYKDADAPTGDTSSAGPAPEPMTPEQMAHVAAVQTKLTPEEAQLAQAVARELSPRQVSAWLHQLCALSVDDAAALIRKTIAANDADAKDGATS